MIPSAWRASSRPRPVRCAPPGTRGPGSRWRAGWAAASTWRSQSRLARATGSPTSRSSPRASCPTPSGSALEDALGTVNTVGGVYVEYRMTRALAELERRYRDAGWLEARLGPPRATYDPRGTVTVAIPVVAGRRFRISSVKAVGASPVAREAVLQMLGLRTGDYFDGPSVRTAIERARHKLARWVELRTSVADDRPEIELEAIVEARR